MIPLDTVIESAPKLERKAPEPAKKKAKKEGEVQAEAPAAKEVAAAAKSEAPAGASKEKKEKKEKPKKEAAGADGSAKKGGSAAAAATADSGDPSPAMIDLRVGHIVDGKYEGLVIVSRCGLVTDRAIRLAVKKHPDADGLYIEVRERSPVLSNEVN